MCHNYQSFGANKMKWEYQVKIFFQQDLKNELNKMGEDGWELINFSNFTTTGQFIQQQSFCVFKRPVVL